MKQLATNDVKNVSLNILLKIHEFCIKNKIRYSMWGGSLIGAIRHKGFIPWDDDIDLLMPRPDYNRFFEIFKDDENIAAFSYQRNGATLPWGRVCDIKSTIGYTKWPFSTKKTGVYVSIFPIDGVSDNLEQNQIQFDACRALFLQSYRMRNLVAHFSTHRSFRENLSLLKLKLLNPIDFFRANKILNITLQEHIKECTKFEFEKSQFANDLAYAYQTFRPKNLFPSEDFREIIEGEFEGHEVCIIKGYDRILRLRYGDYMQLPPIDQQIATHTHTVYYWKD